MVPSEQSNLGRRRVEKVPDTIQGTRYLWQLRPAKQELSREIEKGLALPPLVSHTLAVRQITSLSQARDFLNSRLDNLPSPSPLPDLDEAVARVVKALEQDEKIAVYGDYDVDGITATALLIHFLSRLGGKVSFHIPHRIKEGYGLNVAAVKRLYDQGITLVITVDCGSTDHQAVQVACDLGVDVIVTDHHQPPDSLPLAYALVNPKRMEGKEELRDLAGVGVAFYLATAIRAYYRLSGRWNTSAQPNLKEYLDLVALGTLADTVPLTPTNRILASVGLDELSRTARYGLQALKEVCGLEKQVSDSDVLFRLGPRLNAPGRLGNGDPSLHLLLSTDLLGARSLADELDQINCQRQVLERQLLAEVQALIEADTSLQQSSSLVLTSSAWQKGLLGLIASRLVERFNKPAILLTRVDQRWEGSGRSVSHFDIYAALERCREHLVSFGGHRLAAGLALRHEQISGFRDAFEKVAQDEIPYPPVQRIVEVDGVAQLEEITPELMFHIDQMRPFGVANPEPVFCCQEFHVETLRALKGCHLQMRLRQRNTRMTAIGFNLLESSHLPRPPERLLFSPRWNYWKGERRIQLHIVDYC